MTTKSAERALLDAVDSAYHEQVEAILAEAEDRSQVIMREAHERARRSVRTAFLEAKERAEERIVTLQARAATERRLHEQRRAAKILEAEWALLPKALAERWGNAGVRRRWALHAARVALDQLPREGWQIEHPADWTESERSELAAEVTPALVEAPAFVTDMSVKAGLRIRAGHNVLDATLDGLLADREAIGARLLSMTSERPT
jgi:vacuolar-type H+-ATPase subunit H